ncbi:eukaryotic mitochondrial regulator protein-domain-containing protein [Phlebopus sp. FC_14]|nr:eukaryotic mitochondrial regulator protein-domain-containing protein [Phlebopus sp. FC_14]
MFLQPFPLNPSFEPPVPLSNALRSRLYWDYIADPQANSVRALASKHNLSIKRVDAILRLKGMEEAWLKEKKPLQTGFTKGMERLLGVSDLSDPVKVEEPDGDTPVQYYHTGPKPESTRYDVEEADRQDEIEGKDMARQRYQRLFWETVPEGQEPIMPRALEAEKLSARDSQKSQRNVKVVEREGGRPAFKFIDVGRAFVDERAEARRDKEAARRARKRQVAPRNLA